MFIDKVQQNFMLNTTSIIKCTYKDRVDSYGTCFFCGINDSKIILVTAKHMLEKCISAKLLLTVLHTDINIYNTITLTMNLENDINVHLDYDICTLDITQICNKLQVNGMVPQISPIDTSIILTNYEELDIIQEIIMIGYPSGIINFSQNHPIIRTGVTATSIQERYNDEEKFLTDIPTFGGSSGSPIFIANKQGILFLVEINSQTFNQVTPVYRKNFWGHTKIVGEVKIPNDIGIAINSCIIFGMIMKY